MSTPNIKSWSEEVEESIKGTQAIKGKVKSDSRENSRSRKRHRPNSKSESDTKTRKPTRQVELETDPLILQRRQKQIDYGKNTVGYHNYTSKVPLDKRSKEDPKTPDKYVQYSRRSWDALVKMWRIKLHEYDSNADKSQPEACEDSSDECETLSTDK